MWRRLLLVGLPCLIHCVAPIDAPSAFSEESYLCDAAHIAEFDAHVEECRLEWAIDRSCAGYMSFRGIADLQAIVLDGRVSSATFVAAGQTEEPGRQFTLTADAPYFEFVLKLNHFGIPPEKSKSGYICDLNASAPDDICASSLQAGQTSGEVLNLEARGGNLLALLTSQWREIEIETADELRLTLTANLARGGQIEGCIDVFPSTAAP